MANVLHNEAVKNEQDLQNLVIGLIFRMDKPFTEDYIVQLSNYYLKGSIFYDNIDLLEKYVTDNLDLLQDRDTIRRINGTCYMKNILTKKFPDEYYERHWRMILSSLT